jgi:hypothetical protein
LTAGGLDPGFRSGGTKHDGQPLMASAACRALPGGALLSHGIDRSAGRQSGGAVDVSSATPSHLSDIDPRETVRIGRGRVAAGHHVAAPTPALGASPR